MSLEKQIESTARAMNHAKFWSQENIILLNQYEIMIALTEIKTELAKVKKEPTIEELKTFGPE